MYQIRFYWSPLPLTKQFYLSLILPGLSTDHSVFPFSGFATLLLEQGSQPCIQTCNLVAQIPVFISSKDRMAQLYPQAAGSLFAAFYNSQGYSGGTLNRLHKVAIYIQL
jgi:hypothetical protein